MRSLFASDNPYVPCGIEGKHGRRETCGSGDGRCGLVGGASSVQEKAPTVEKEGRAGAERTVNISAMFVTLDVSKLSGWLNADAYCREKWEAKEG